MSSVSTKRRTVSTMSFCCAVNSNSMGLPGRETIADAVFLHYSKANALQRGCEARHHEAAHRGASRSAVRYDWVDPPDNEETSMNDAMDREKVTEELNAIGFDGIEFIEFATSKPQ